MQQQHAAAPMAPQAWVVKQQQCLRICWWGTGGLGMLCFACSGLPCNIRTLSDSSWTQCVRIWVGHGCVGIQLCTPAAVCM